MAQLKKVGAGQVKSSLKIHPAPLILKHSAKAADACKITHSAKALPLIPQPLEADEEVATKVMPTADHHGKLTGAPTFDF